MEEARGWTYERGHQVTFFMSDINAHQQAHTMERVLNYQVDQIFC